MADNEMCDSDSDDSVFDVGDYFSESVPTTGAGSELPSCHPVVSAPVPTVTHTQVHRFLRTSPINLDRGTNVLFNCVKHGINMTVSYHLNRTQHWKIVIITDGSNLVAIFVLYYRIYEIII